MKKLLKIVFLIPLVIVLGWVGYKVVESETPTLPPYMTRPIPDKVSTDRPVAQDVAADPVSTTLPTKKILPTDYHIFQSFNNCAPAALSMALSQYGIRATQEALMAELRPFNNPQGKNDDKSTPPDELAAKAEEYGLAPYYRGGGDIEVLKRLINAGVPVIVRTLLDPEKDYAHYRVVKGYDDATGEIIQDDSLDGKNLHFSYAEWNRLWKPFNYAYLVLAAPHQVRAVEAALGESMSENVSWQKAIDMATSDVAKNPEDIMAQFDLSVAYYYTGEYEESVTAFEKIETTLPRIYTWYQVEPIRSYYELGVYDRVFELTNAIITPTNAAWTELYLLRGNSYLKMGDKAKAKAEFEKAVYYNVNFKPAREALANI